MAMKIKRKKPKIYWLKVGVPKGFGAVTCHITGDGDARVGLVKKGTQIDKRLR